jgi:uncharacterized protein YegJ (DUF2314 family)
MRIAFGYEARTAKVLAATGGRSYLEAVRNLSGKRSSFPTTHLPMKTNPLLLIGPLLIAGCAAQRVEHPLAREIRRTGVQPEIFRIEDRDAQMHKAVSEARRTVGVFIAALKHPAKGQHDFEVKKPCLKDGEVEHLWLSEVEFSGNRFHGRVDNRPRKITGLKFGDRVSVNPEEISDWAFVDNGKLVGGYTIRVLSQNLSPERRKEFENETKVRINTK